MLTDLLLVVVVDVKVNGDDWAAFVDVDVIVAVAVVVVGASSHVMVLLWALTKWIKKVLLVVFPIKNWNRMNKNIKRIWKNIWNQRLTISIFFLFKAYCYRVFACEQYL